MRQSTLVLAATSLLTLAPLVGCDEQPSSAAQRHLDDAVATISEAQLGFVPNAEDSNLAQHRLDTLEQAMDDLRQAIAQGDRGQQVAARRLLADVHATAAQAALRDASGEDASLRLRAGSIITQLGAYERAHARAAGFDRDNALTLEQINEEIREQRASREKAQEQRKTIEAELEKLRKQRNALREQIDKARGEARGLRDKAFVTEGDEQYELEEKADQLVLGAEKQGAEVERLDGEIGLAEADLALIDQRIETIDELVKDLQSQVKTVETQTTQLAEWHEQATADRAAALETLQEEYGQLIGAYHEAVRSRFERARERADAAADEARQAASAAAGPNRQGAQAEHLARVSDQARVLVTHADAIGGLGRVLAIVAERIEATQPDAARPFEEGLAELIERQDRLAEEAEAVMGSANELATELRDGSGDVAEYAAGQIDWLESQQARLRNSRLSD